MAAPARPLIGLVLDFEESGSFSRRPYYALRHHYFRAVHRAGGAAVGLPPSAEELVALLPRLDGLLVPGGSFPSPSDWYLEGERPAAAPPANPHPRAVADQIALSWALERDRPVLAICAGMQMMAGLLGARMVADARRHTAINHLDAGPAEARTHDITLVAGTRLAALLGGSAPLAVNSVHREAVVQVPDGLTAAAWAQDGIVEAVEVPGSRFALGVQWHPEFFLAPEDPDLRLFTGLLAAC